MRNKLLKILLILLVVTSCSKESMNDSLEPEKEINTKPSITLLSPNNNAEFEAGTVEQLLTWKAEDAENDVLMYDLYFGETLPNTPTVQNISDLEYRVTGLENNTTFRWKVIVNDGTESVESNEQLFKIKEELKGVYLEWQNVNASAYDLYFGENSASEKIVSNTKELSHLFQDLEVGKKYYYKVVPKGSSFVFDENSFFYQEQGVKIFDGNTSLNNQDEITNFGQKSFTEITGALRIQQNFRRDIRELGWLQDLLKVGSIDLRYIDGLTSLYGLHNITFIKQGVYVRNITNITEIELDKLLSIGGSLDISDNKNLEKISMNKLSNIWGDLILGGKVIFLLNNTTGYSGSIDSSFGNPLVSDITFDNLNNIYGNINLYKNESLENLNFLRNLEGSYKDFIIWDNDALTDISALSKFKSMAQSFAIVKNDNLSNLIGLENITIVAWDMLISENDNLESINLDTLDTTSKLNISNNPNIQNISNLSSLRRIGNGGVYIYGNDKLNDYCGLYGLYEYGQVNGTTYINNNKYNPTSWGIANGYCRQ